MLEMPSSSALGRFMKLCFKPQTVCSLSSARLMIPATNVFCLSFRQREAQGTSSLHLVVLLDRQHGLEADENGHVL